jgi:apolipoprotein N-acyltransferase
LLAALGTLAALPAHVVQPAPEDRRRVALVQGEGLGLERLLALSRSVGEPIDAIVWPELALAFDPRAFPRVEEALRALLADTGAALLVVGCRALDDAGEPQNAARLLGRDGWIGRHVKQRLVPFVDTGRASGGVAAHATPLGRIATPICFDLDASALAADAVADGAELLLVPNLDPAAWGDAQRSQHGELARHRAAELGRWVAVASGAGRTQVLDPRGARRAELPLDRPGVLIAEVGTARERTPYARWGRWCGPFCTFVVALLAVALLVAGAKTPGRA